MNAHPKPLPPLTSDAEAEDFVETADLSEYDLSGFRPMRFEIEPKAAFGPVARIPIEACNLHTSYLHLSTQT